MAMTAASQTAPALLAMRGIVKRFGAVTACDGVDLTVRAGDVLGLLGENGAGKTSLMNVLFGTYAADAGAILIEGRPVQIRDSADALRLGIGMVNQHFHLVPRHTVLQNLMVGRPGKGPTLDRAGALAQLREIGEAYGLNLDPDLTVQELAIGEQQRLEIVKALFRGARILILDEPTAALTPQETEGLFRAVRAMAARGLSVIFISHKLEEVRAITTHVVVMRQGRVVAELRNAPELSGRRIAELMCGRPIQPPIKGPATPGPVLLRLEEVSTAGSERRRLKSVSLEVRGGEILGIAGVSGNGQLELADLVAGVIEPLSGRIEIDGRSVDHITPRSMQELKVGRIPEDRMGVGLLTHSPLADSMVLPRVHRPPFSRHGLIDRKAILAFAREEIERYQIRTAGPLVRTGTLSGGNLQKALLARELAGDPMIVLAAQPTRGLDVAAAGFVHGEFLKLRGEGRAILVISEDLEELFLLADRIAVMSAGRIVGEMPIAEATVERIGLMMTGAETA